MTSILLKQLSELTKNELPNIKIKIDDKNIKHVECVFYYKKTNPNDEKPLFFPKVHSDDLFIKGDIDLDDFPNRPPRLVLYGDMPHSHVYMEDMNRFKICFSLDESFQWFFNGKHMQSSKFNPSVSLRYYLIAIYKFIAEDDLEHPITEDRKVHCIDYWKKYKSDDKPIKLLSYQECLAAFENEADKVDYNVIEKSINTLYGLVKLPEQLVKMRDFVDKDVLLLQNDPIVYPINYVKKSDRHIYSVVSLDMMKLSTFNGGIRKTSTSVDFNDCFPLLVHSRIADKLKPLRVLDDLVSKVFSRTRTNQIIKLGDKPQQSDFYLYIISELFNELAIDVFKDNMFPCEEVLKAFAYLHHMLLYIGRDDNKFLDKGENILDFFEKDDTNRDKKVCPNLGILMTQYLMSKKQRTFGALIDELLTRNVLWSLMKVKDCNGVVDYNITDKKFMITNMEKWIELTWKNSHAGMQRFAFQQLYNDRFNKESLQTMDDKFGLVPDTEIVVFQHEVKKLCNWNKLSGREGYKTFFEYFGLSIDDLEVRLTNALNRSSKLGYHDFIVNKEWKSYISKKGGLVKKN